MVLVAGEPPPFGPWAGLGLAAFCLVCALSLVWLIQRAYDRDPRNVGRGNSRPRWWRIRVLSHESMTAVPMAFAGFCSSLSMIGYSLLLWTGFRGAAIASVLLGLSGLGCFLWGLYDSFGHHAWKRNGRDEYTLW